jgi:SHS2 domain-containing protein
MHEFFEHTADIGIRVRAADLETLFVEAATALFEAIVEDLDAVRPQRTVAVRVNGTDREYLLFDWLKELLYRFDAERLLFSRFTVKITPDGLEATAHGEELDRERHELGHEVKAITYHGLRVEQSDGEWLAEVIVDI